MVTRQVRHPGADDNLWRCAWAPWLWKRDVLLKIAQTEAPRQFHDLLRMFEFGKYPPGAVHCINIKSNLDVFCFSFFSLFALLRVFLSCRERGQMPTTCSSGTTWTEARVANRFAATQLGSEHGSEHACGSGKQSLETILLLFAYKACMRLVRLRLG